MWFAELDVFPSQELLCSMRALLRAGGEVEGSAMHQQLTWLVSQYVQVGLDPRYFGRAAGSYRSGRTRVLSLLSELVTAYV